MGRPNILGLTGEGSKGKQRKLSGAKAAPLAKAAKSSGRFRVRKAKNVAGPPRRP